MAGDAFTQTRLMPTFGVSAGQGLGVQGSGVQVFGSSGFSVQVSGFRGLGQGFQGLRFAILAQVEGFWLPSLLNTGLRV